MRKSFRTYLQSFFGRFLDLIYPPRADEMLVAGFSDADFYSLPAASEKNSSEHLYPGVISLFSYRDPRVQALIWELKYRRNIRALSLAGQALADRIASELEDKIMFSGWSGNILLTTVPVTANRMRERTYSQTDMLCREIAMHLEFLTYRPDIIRKVRETTRQNKTRNRGERLHNLNGAFQAASDPSGRALAAGTYVVLVDDVTTTGATLNEVRQTLVNAGAKDIIAFTLAH